jgi:DNA polymerase-3 subunit delta'
VLVAQAPGLPADKLTALARVAGGRLDRAERLLDDDAAARRRELLVVARSVYRDDEFDPAAAARAVTGFADSASAEARARTEKESEWLDLPDREREQRLKRAEFGAGREAVLEALEELGAWYRDLVVVAVGAERVVVHCDHLEELRKDGVPERLAPAERAAEEVRQSWREFEELNLQPRLALESLFVRLRAKAGPGRRGMTFSSGVVSSAFALDDGDAVRRPDRDSGSRLRTCSAMAWRAHADRRLGRPERGAR